MLALLISGSILPPIRAYASHEDEMMKTLVSRQASSSTSSSTDEKIPPVFTWYRKVLPGEHLTLKDGNWTNKEGTIRLPAIITKIDEDNILTLPFTLTVFENGEEGPLERFSPHYGETFRMTRSLREGSDDEIDEIVKHSGLVIGRHYLFSINYYYDSAVGVTRCQLQ